MSDKEPRRRKKRKDLQAARKEDLHTEDQIFTSPKMEVKDADQEVEEEVSSPSHQPSVFAKFVFVLLFSALVVSMSFVFISLQGTHSGDIDIFEDHHAEESEIHHDIHEAHHDEEGHAETEHDEDEHGETDHDDTGTWSLSTASIQENIEAFLPGIGSFFSSKDEPSIEADDTEEQESSAGENVEEKESADEEEPEVIDIKSNIDASSLQNNIEEDVNDIEDDEDLDEEDDELIPPEIPTQRPPDVSTSRAPVNTETTSQTPQRGDISPEPELDEDDDIETTTSPNVLEDSAYTTYAPNTADEEDDEDASYLELMPQEESNFVENVVEDKGVEEPEFYEKGDVTNEADYEIRRQLDELEDALEKGFVDDDNDDDNDEDDDDDYEGDDGIVDEFDFWQF